jgi:hypothetical protein
MCLPFEGLNIRYKGLLFQIVKADGYLSTMMSQTDTGLLSNPEGVAAYSPGFAEPARTSLLAEPWGKRNRNQFRAIDIAMSAVNSPLGTKTESTQGILGIRGFYEPSAHGTTPVGLIKPVIGSTLNREEPKFRMISYLTDNEPNLTSLETWPERERSQCAAQQTESDILAKGTA